ncbi:MAG: hypothetical protein QXG08_06260 [Candidatus Methanomethyliaceae archaeon]
MEGADPEASHVPTPEGGGLRPSLRLRKIRGQSEGEGEKKGEEEGEGEGEREGDCGQTESVGEILPTGRVRCGYHGCRNVCASWLGFLIHLRKAHGKGPGEAV